MSLKGLKIYLFIGIVAVLYLCSLCNVYSDRYIEPDKPVTNLPFYDYRGVIHFHSTYSDGSGSFAEIVEAAKLESLDFIISADHDTFLPLAEGEEGYRDSILTIAGCEISTPAAHMVYLNPDASIADYPVGDIFENYKNHFIKNGVFIVAHPFLKKRPFTDWSWGGYSGIELINGDYEWRNDSPIELIQALIAYPFIQNTLNYLADIPEKQLAAWDSVLQHRPCFITGAGDVHANIKVTKSFSIHFPSYRRGFRIVQTHVLTEKPLSGDFKTDKETILKNIKRGRIYAALGGFSSAGGFSFHANAFEKIFMMGDSASVNDKPVLNVIVPDTTDIEVVLIKDGKRLLSTNDWKVEYNVTESGVYRAEVYQIRSGFPLFTKKRRPWIYSNPIYVFDEPEE